MRQFICGNKKTSWVSYILSNDSHHQRLHRKLNGINPPGGLDNGEDDSLPPPPLLPLLVQTPAGVGKEHHILLALQLSLEELQRGAVEAQHVLQGGGENTF